MVGVAGRSKACGTCRKRRIRCGLEQPQCSNCIRSNRFCTGYQRERIFLVNQARHPGTFPKQANDKHCLRDDSQSLADATGTVKLKSAGGPTIPFWKQKHKGFETLVAYPQSGISSLPTHRQQLLALYLSDSIPSPVDFGPGPTTWIHWLPILPDYPPCLAAAIDALTLSHLRSLSAEACSPDATTHAEAFRQQSLHAYTTGLWHLQRALWSPSAMYLDSTLAACLLLALYELLECPAGTRIGYISHQNGAIRLIQLRGPAAHQDGFSHALFLAFRTGGILSAMEKHEAGCFLAEKEWIEKPWGGDEEKGRAEEIWDWIALAPGVLARTDEMQRAKPVRSLCLALSVLEFCWEADAELEQWWEGLKESCGGVVYWPVLVDYDGVELSQHGQERLFPVRFEFLNLRTAIVMMSYWSLLSVIYNGMMLLYQVLANVPVDRKAVKALGDKAPAALLRGVAVDCPPDCACGGDADVPCIVRFDMSSMPALAHRADFMTPIRNICQSVQYCSQPTMKSLGYSSAIAPISIAVDVIKDYPWVTRERDWMIDVLREKTSGLPYLKNFWWAQSGTLLEM